MLDQAGKLLERVFDGALDESDVAAMREALMQGDPDFAARTAELLRRMSVLIEVANRVSDSLSLDDLLPRLIELITDVLAAERATLFLYDSETEELFSRVARGDGIAEIRVPITAGIVGSVFRSGQAEIIDDAYADARFNAEVDRRTGYRTRSILCVPLRNRNNAVIGVSQVLNKSGGPFLRPDQALLEAITAQAASALEQARLFERLERARHEEAQMLEISEAISSDLQLDTLLSKIMKATTTLLDAERSTLFIHDPDTNELWSKVAEGEELKEIRIPANAGIAGAAFSRSEILNIPDAYADARFNQTVDRQTGYRTRNILCLPVTDKFGGQIGVVQVLNRRGGPFTAVDTQRLKSFSSQIAVAIQNAQLFTDVLELKNYNESILKSLSNGVITLDKSMKIIKVNEAALKILRRTPPDVLERPADQVFGNTNAWISKSLDYVARTGGTDYHADTDFKLSDGGGTAVNLTVTPLNDINGKAIGFMLVFEDITREKRVRSTMARYMAKEVVDRLLESGEEVMQGTAQVATVLFSDIRSFTTLAESMSARDTVSMLNEYFTEMVEVIFQRGGILDKYIGDAIMAIFGAPIASDTDPDNAVDVANLMIRALQALNGRRRGQKLSPIEIGIGLSTGEVLAGSIGSIKRMDYTVIGDSVNLAARLESANKHYGTAILVSGTTVDSLKQKRLLMREIDLIQVKGKVKPNAVYESLEYHNKDSNPNLVRMLPIFEDGLKRYRSQDWTGAMARFAEVLELVPGDGPARIFSDRCRFYRERPPGDDWNGVWIMSDK